MNWKRGKGGALILDGRRIGFTVIGPSGAAQRRHGPSAPGVGGGSLADAPGDLAHKGESRTAPAVPKDDA